jgi:hypothetical protein
MASIKQRWALINDLQTRVLLLLFIKISQCIPWASRLRVAVRLSAVASFAEGRRRINELPFDRALVRSTEIFK